MMPLRSGIEVAGWHVRRRGARDRNAWVVQHRSGKVATLVAPPDDTTVDLRCVLSGAAVQSAIVHPAIVPVLECLAVGDVPVVVVDSVGPTVRFVLHFISEPSPELVYMIACQALAGLGAIHRQGARHRTFGPSQLLLDLVEEDLVARVDGIGMLTDELGSTDPLGSVSDVEALGALLRSFDAAYHTRMENHPRWRSFVVAVDDLARTSPETDLSAICRQWIEPSLRSTNCPQLADAIRSFWRWR